MCGRNRRRSRNADGRVCERTHSRRWIIIVFKHLMKHWRQLALTTIHSTLLASPTRPIIGITATWMDYRRWNKSKVRTQLEYCVCLTCHFSLIRNKSVDDAPQSQYNCSIHDVNPSLVLFRLTFEPMRHAFVSRSQKKNTQNSFICFVHITYVSPGIGLPSTRDATVWHFFSILFFIFNLSHLFFGVRLSFALSAILSLSLYRRHLRCMSAVHVFEKNEKVEKECRTRNNKFKINWCGKYRHGKMHLNDSELMSDLIAHFFLCVFHFRSLATATTRDEIVYTQWKRQSRMQSLKMH